MTRNKKTTLLILSVLSIGFLILSTYIVGRFSVEGYEIIGLPKTWKIEREIVGLYGSNTLSVKKRIIERRLSSLPYVEEVKVSVKGNKVMVEGKAVDKAVIVTDTSKSFLLLPSGTEALDTADIPILKSNYLVVHTSPSVITLFESMEENTLITALLDAGDAFDYSGLITYAEYDNNKSSIFSGSLTLVLGPLDSVLTVRDLRNAHRISESIEIIQREYASDGNKLTRGTREFVLDDSLMEKTR